MTTSPERPLEALIRLGDVDPWLTLAPLRHGSGDPTIRLARDACWRAARTPQGPATIRIERLRDTFRVLAWGPGREWAISAAPRLLGAEDHPHAFRPRHPVLRDLARRMPGLRFGRTDAVFEALLPSVIEQKVTGDEARRSYRAVLRAFGERAPGPVTLLVPPRPEAIARQPYHAFHPLGLEQRRAETLRAAGRAAPRLEAATALEPEAALAVLRSVPGVGPWTAAEVARVSFGDPDAVSLGDYHMPRLVCWALAGESRGDDARMLELLEPYRGQRARAVRLLEAAGIRPPRRGPRMAPRSITAI